MDFAGPQIYERHYGQRAMSIKDYCNVPAAIKEFKNDLFENRDYHGMNTKSQYIQQK